MTHVKRKEVERGEQKKKKRKKKNTGVGWGGGGCYEGKTRETTFFFSYALRCFSDCQRFKTRQTKHFTLIARSNSATQENRNTDTQQWNAAGGVSDEAAILKQSEMPSWKQSHTEQDTEHQQTFN